ncbi:MAG: AAA family ATPase [Anaerolineae bacterium]
MALSTHLTDEQLIALIEEYFDQGAHLSGWTLRARERVEAVRAAFFNSDFLERASDGELVSALTAYYKQVVAVPLLYRAIETAPGRLRLALRTLLDEDANLAARVDSVLLPSSPLHQSGLGKSFYSPLFQALDPERNPLWNNRTEAGLRALGLNRWKPSDSPGSRYLAIQSAYLDLARLHPDLDLFQIDHFMRFVVIGVGADTLRAWDLASETDSLPPPLTLSEESGAYQEGGAPTMEAAQEWPAEDVALTVEEAPITLESAAEDAWLPVGRLAELRDLALERRQIIFHGPPGTGKTHVAQLLARLLATPKGRVHLVQFHPAYSYEEFIEGIRPEVRRGGELTYTVQPGLFARLCVEAARGQGYTVLVVDEINRANLPHVFGELLYALEYRGQPVALPYSGGRLVVPPNLLLIGTMNSADRAVALLDQALRRRFAFVPFTPDPELLRRFLAAHPPAPLWAADFLEALNRRLAEDGISPDYHIGHTYFLRPDLDADAVERAWRYAIRPTLVELFYARPAALDAYDRIAARFLTPQASVGDDRSG